VFLLGATQTPDYRNSLWGSPRERWQLR